MAEAALVVALWNLAVLVALYRKVRALEQPVTAKARAELAAAVAEAEELRQEYVRKTEHRRSEKDMRQLAAERALSALQGVPDGRDAL